MPSTAAATRQEIARQEILEGLTGQLRDLEGRQRAAGAIVSSGQPTLDRFLPEGGFRRGTLVEWLAGHRGSGAATLALLAASQVAAMGGAVVVIDRQRRFYPPAAAGLGLDLARLVVVRPASDEEEAWTVDQVLRCRGVAALWCWLAGHDRPTQHDDHAQRRWQLAAEASGVVGFLLRDALARSAPSWAELRLLVEPLADASADSQRRRLRVELLRHRGGKAGSAIELELTAPQILHQEHSHVVGRPHRQTRHVHLASPMASAKTVRRSRRA